MEAEEILTTAKTSTTPPQGWIVLPLTRSKVVLGIIGWVFGIVLGLGLFAFVAYIVIPTNYEHGFLPALFTTILLGVFLFVGLGSFWSLILEVRRLMEADKHIIVITPENFVKQEGGKVTYVPLANVRHVTARGTPPPNRSVPRDYSAKSTPSAGERFSGLIFGHASTREGANVRRTRMRTPTSLAFVDTRTDNEVIVVTDGVYGDPFMIATLLKQYAASV